MRHKFSPIISRENLDEALLYVAAKGLELGRRVMSRSTTIDTITIFTQSVTEHKAAKELIKGYGPVSEMTHGKTLYVDSDFTLLGNKIVHLGVRSPDSERPEVGYVDYPVDDYSNLVAQAEFDPHMKLIKSGRGLSLIELAHPDFDVRGYIVAVDEHQG